VSALRPPPNTHLKTLLIRGPEQALPEPSFAAGEEALDISKARLPFIDWSDAHFCQDSYSYLLPSDLQKVHRFIITILPIVR
jgi:hypothetical protein